MAEPAKPPSDRRRLLDKLVRELLRSEGQAIEHAPREARRIGETPPVLVLRDVARHAAELRPRLDHALEAHGLVPGRSSVGITLTSLRYFVADRVHDAERAYRGALLDLRHGFDVVRVLREVARLEELFALIRWCDDWLGARRTLVARVEAQLGWFTQHAAPAIAAGSETTPAASPRPGDEPPPAPNPSLNRDRG